MKRSYNSYCKQNFIDYNFLVDEIIQMSQSYNLKNMNLIFDEETFKDKKNQDHIQNLLKNKIKGIFQTKKFNENKNEND
jgi:hypothetical protein